MCIQCQSCSLQLKLQKRTVFIYAYHNFFSELQQIFQQNLYGQQCSQQFFLENCHSFSFRLLHSSIRRYQERSNEVLKHVHQNGIEPSHMVQHGLCTLITVILYPTETISMTTKSQLCHPLCFLLPFYSDPDLFLQLISYIQPSNIYRFNSSLVVHSIKSAVAYC